MNPTNDQPDLFDGVFVEAKSILMDLGFTSEEALHGILEIGSKNIIMHKKSIRKIKNGERNRLRIFRWFMTRR